MLYNKKHQKSISEIIEEKFNACDGETLMPTLRGNPVAFWLSPTGAGIETDKLPGYILTWEHFDYIIEKANELGGKMYRGDALAQAGGKLGEDVPYDCMEGFIASDLLYAEEGSLVTRRSTYYSGVLAWAGIITIHRSQGKGSFITVNPPYRNI